MKRYDLTRVEEALRDLSGDDTEAPEGAEGTEGTEEAEAQVHVIGTSNPVNWEMSGLDDACHLMHRTRLNLEVDDGLSVPVALDDHNAGVILEATQRMRECREREKAVVPPVKDFGETSYVPMSGGDW